MEKRLIPPWKEMMTMTATLTTTTTTEWKPIERCRLCYSSRLESLFSLGTHYVSDFVTQEKIYSGAKAPLELLLCQNCTLVQLAHTVPPEQLYTGTYWYRSGVTQTMRDALRDITCSLEALLPLRAGDVVLDIGSNDGTLLRSYTRSERLCTIGVEPAANLAEEGRKNITKFINKLWSAKAYKAVEPRKARIITAIGMFYDLERPLDFLGDIAECLEEEGIFVCQLMCLRNMLESCDLGNICHEHLEYYSMASLEYLFRASGLQVFRMEKNAVNGGSYRFYLRKGYTDSGSLTFLDKYILDETILGYQQKSTYTRFYQTLENSRERVCRFVQEITAEGKNIHVYGASTKGNTILQYYGLSYPTIRQAADRSPAKWGLYTAGTGIPIVSESTSKENAPDYYLVLPYAFLSEFLRREENWLQAGGKFIVPLPEPRVIERTPEGAIHERLL